MSDKRQKVIAILWLLVALLQPITDICISEYGKLATVMSVYNFNTAATLNLVGLDLISVAAFALCALGVYKLQSKIIAIGGCVMFLRTLQSYFVFSWGESNPTSLLIVTAVWIIFIVAFFNKKTLRIRLVYVFCLYFTVQLLFSLRSNDSSSGADFFLSIVRVVQLLLISILPLLSGLILPDNTTKKAEDME